MSGLNCRRVARSSSSFFSFPLLFFRLPGGVWGAKCCLWGAGFCRRQSPSACHPSSQEGCWDRGEKQRGSQQLPLSSNLIRLKTTHSPASWGISFEVSFPALPEVGFRPCFSDMIPWIIVSIDKVTLGTQRGKPETTWIPYIEVFIFFQELSEASIFTVA